MGQAISMAAVYCCCTAGSSLCQSCFGSVEAGTTGRKRSVLLLAIVIALSLWFQYDVGPSIVRDDRDGWVVWTLKWIPGLGGRVRRAWMDPCLSSRDYEPSEEELGECAGNAGVYRPTGLATLYFCANAAATKMVPTLNREAWPAKYTLFAFALLLTVFVPSDPLFSSVYLWIARLGAAVFLIVQQVILIDVAYNWNDDWVEKANQNDRLSFGSGSGWLHAIVGVCVALYGACLSWIALLYAHYTGDGTGSCAGNTWAITLTLLGITGVTALQLSSEGGSLLTSGVISLYAVYLCFSIVSHNPVGRCNPRLGENDVWGITIGLVLTTVSLAWTGWSWSAEPRLRNAESLQSARAVDAPTAFSPFGEDGHDHESTTGGGSLDLGVPLVDGEEAATAGRVTTDGSAGAARRESASLAHVWKLNAVLALVACYVAMVLTGWGTISSEVDPVRHTAANPTVGRANMAILGVSQWLALLLYAWTLVAPLLFPDRDFS
ncbi:unnamed protein product [Pseudo-nitzschia multistriata]|uniref:Serine incorporator n=1 Tax=Pseudo-nitzschia multistriata TaxID=183589 RepID=A0A448ZNG3_9STRA|nr:unnamed protein product [Pseudo-nitzschia multistriata]